MRAHADSVKSRYILKKFALAKLQLYGVIVGLPRLVEDNAQQKIEIASGMASITHYFSTSSNPAPRAI